MRMRYTEDIQPLSEFRSHAAEHLERVRETRRPLVLTQRGRSSAVILDVGEYDRLLDELELLRDIRTAESQLAEGKGVPHAAARERVLSSLRG